MIFHCSTAFNHLFPDLLSIYQLRTITWFFGRQRIFSHILRLLFRMSSLPQVLHNLLISSLKVSVPIMVTTYDSSDYALSMAQ